MLLQCIGSTQRREANSFKIASHGNKRMHVLPRFLVVKSSHTVVSQFVLFLSPAGHRCWKHLWPWLGRTILGGGAERALLTPLLGTAVPRWQWPRGWSSRARRAAASWHGTKEPEAALIYTPGLGLGRDRGRQPVPIRLPSPLLQLSETGSAASGVPLHSLLEWKKVICGVLTFQNALFFILND